MRTLTHCSPPRWDPGLNVISQVCHNGDEDDDDDGGELYDVDANEYREDSFCVFSSGWLLI